jgi:hypothetical protein
MRSLRFALRFALGPILFVALFATASIAQNNRSFVSGAGLDSNPCSLTLPCRTFGQAISVTNTGGEVIVLTSAGYGPFTINKAVTVEAPAGVYAGITATGSSDGIDIDAGSMDTVILRGLTVTSQGSSGSGIVFNSGGALHIETCVTSGFLANGSVDGIHGSGIGINNFGNVFVTDTIARDNDIGITIGPTGTGTTDTAYVAMDQVQLDGNTVYGMFVVPSGPGAIVTAAIRNSSASDNGEGNGVGIFAAGVNGGTADLDIESCLIANNDGSGLTEGEGSGSKGAMSISNCTITGNTGDAYFSSGGTIYTRGQNTIIGNGSDSGSLTALAGQ